MPKLFKTTDAKLNPRLANQVASLRGAISEAAERTPIPQRFVVTDMPNRPAVTITDTQTGRSVELGLCDYYGARTLLAALFGEEK